MYYHFHLGLTSTRTRLQIVNLKHACMLPLLSRSLAFFLPGGCGVTGEAHRTLAAPPRACRLRRWTRINDCSNLFYTFRRESRCFIRIPDTVPDTSRVWINYSLMDPYSIYVKILFSGWFQFADAKVPMCFHVEITELRTQFTWGPSWPWVWRAMKSLKQVMYKTVAGSVA